jgi:membrane-bound inhibitor of C-type lysozyme
MTIRLAPCLALVLLTAACGRGQPAAPTTAPAAPPSSTVAKAPAEAAQRTITYRCGNGRTLDAVYARDKAVIQWGGKRHELKITRSASGARYVGDGLQWWTKGMREGTLSQLGLGELIASDVGITCTTDEVLPPATPPPPGSPGGLPDDKTPVSEAPFKPTSAQGAADVVQTYYAHLGARAYGKAWSLWGEGGQASGKASTAAFAKSFDRYASYNAQVGAAGEIEGAAGSLYVSVPVVIYGRLKSGAEVHEKGEAQLRRANDVPGSTAAQRKWHIVKIETKPTA